MKVNGYKVVRTIDGCEGIYRSCIVTQQGAQLAYEVGRITRPWFGSLFAFTQKADAFSFAKRELDRNDEEAFVFHAILTDPLEIQRCANASLSLCDMVESWKVATDTYDAPQGTVICREVELVEEAWEE